MKRTLSAILATILSLSILAGCGSKPGDVYKNKPATPELPKTPVTLKLGMLPITEGLPFWVADKKGFFKQQNLTVEFVPFKSATDRDAAMMSGAIDGMVSDLVAAATFIGSGSAKVHVVSMAMGVKKEEAPMGILSSPKSGIKTVQDLKGKEIAISNGSIMQYVAEKLLAENGLKPTDVKWVSIPQIPVRLETLLADKVNAAILPDPLFYEAGSKHANIILDNSHAKQNYYQSVIIMSDKAIAEKADGIKRMFLAYNQAVTYIMFPPAKDAKDEYGKPLDPNPVDLKGLLAENANLPADIQIIYHVPPFSMTQAPKQADVESVVQWLLDKGLLKSKLTFDQIVNTSLLQAPAK